MKGVNMFERIYLRLAPEGDNGGAGSGGAQGDAGGAGGGQNGGDGKGGEGSGGAGDGDKPISKADHDRAIADMHKFKTEAKKNADALAAMQKQIEDMKATGLKSKEQYKEYSEQLETKVKELEQKNTTLTEGIAKTFKSMAVKAAAKDIGITEQGAKDLDLLALDQVNVEFTTDGRVIVSGEKEAAEFVKKTRPGWFTTGTAANINTGGKGGSGTPETLTAQYMNELESKDPKKYRELMPKYVKQVSAKRR